MLVRILSVKTLITFISPFIIEKSQTFFKHFETHSQKVTKVSIPSKNHILIL